MAVELSRARLAKKSAEIVLQLHAPAALALQSYMVCHSASLMIYGYMTGVYAGQNTASNESFGHGIIVVVNVYRAVAVRGMLLGLKAAHRLRSRLQAVQIGADTLLLLTVADAGDTRSGVDFKENTVKPVLSRIKSLERLAGHERRMAHDFHRAPTEPFSQPERALQNRSSNL